MRIFHALRKLTLRYLLFGTRISSAQPMTPSLIALQVATGLPFPLTHIQTVATVVIIPTTIPITIPAISSFDSPPSPPFPLPSPSLLFGPGALVPGALVSGAFVLGVLVSAVVVPSNVSTESTVTRACVTVWILVISPVVMTMDGVSTEDTAGGNADSV